MATVTPGAPPTVVPEISPPDSIPGRPEEQLELQEPVDADEDNIDYPKGLQLWLSMSSLMLAMVFVGLDMTIVAVAVPSMTDYFKTINDIGWYSSAYAVAYASFIFLSSQLYKVYSVKKLYLTAICIFQIGSLLSTIAPKSGIFILGRFIAGIGASVMSIGKMVIIVQTLPRARRPLAISIGGGINCIAMVSAPLVGGALIDAFNWRACFGINLPFGLITFVTAAYSYKPTVVNPDTSLPFRAKVAKMDLLGTIICIPCIVSLLIALQWGGTKYGWDSAIIICLLVTFAVLLAAFGFIQYRGKDNATLPPRILKQRTVIAGAWFAACCNGILAVTEYFISIYFQGVKGYTATKSGLLGVPLIVGLTIAYLLAGFGTTIIGYYHPFMLATSLLAPIASGLLTTLNLDESPVKVASLLGFLGIAVGLGLQGPTVGLQNVLALKDVGTGTAITGFAGAMGSAGFICASSGLFQTRLMAEINQHSPGVNTTRFDRGGLTDVRKYVGQERLRNVLLGYDEAVSQTLYIPVALGVLTVAGSIFIERKSVKKKRS